MFRFSPAVVLSCLVLVLAGCSQSDPVEVQAIRDCFDSYKQHILAKNGKSAIQFVDANTISYYGTIQQKAMSAGAAEVRQLPIVDKVTVLMIRHMIPVNQLSSMKGEDLFVHAVEEGWIGEEAATNTLGNVSVSGDSAKGVHIAAGKKTPIKWSFVKEDGKWKLDITSIMPIANEAFKKVVQDSGMSEDVLLINILQSMDSKPVPADIWEPLDK